MRKTSETKAKRRHPVGIQWKVFLSLLLFAGLILSLLWLCQVVFLDDIYKTVRIREIRSAARSLCDCADEPVRLSARAQTVCENGGVCVIAFRLIDDQNATLLVSVDTQDECAIHHTDGRSKFILYSSARAAGGSNLQRFCYDSDKGRYYSIEGSLYDPVPADTRADSESIIYTVVTENRAGETVVILLDSVISPLDATVHTLNLILVIVSVLLVLLALATAAVISHYVSRPIKSMNRAARELADGNYGVTFCGGAYRETDELADSLNHAAQELSKVDALRRELIANISHDLRTPLTMIRGYSEAMRDLPGENTPENAQIIIDETERLSSLVNDVLDLSQIESETGPFTPAPFDLTDAVSRTVGRYSKLCERDGYRIGFVCDRHVTVFSDEARIMQVIYNLVGNAVTHTGEDKTVTVTQAVYNDGWVKIAVTDTGAGIPADKLDLIWDRYYKADAVHKRAAMGTGLGLSIVKNIMERCGGRYGVISREGYGSTFWVELPYQAPSPGE